MRTTATQQILDHQDMIQHFIVEHGNILNRSSLMTLLHDLQEKLAILTTTTLTGLTTLLIRLRILKTISILYRGRLIYRQLATNTFISPYEIALSIAPKQAHLSHLSALYVNNLTNLDPTTIYVNYEQSPKPKQAKNAQLTQAKVDHAFLRPVRKTSNIATFVYMGISYTVVLLNGKNTHYLGVHTIKPFGFSKSIRVSTIERSLIESVIRPSYAGGVAEVLTTFQNAKESSVSINRLLAYLQKMAYIYPYVQAIYFYAFHAHYSTTQLQLIQKRFPDSIDQPAIKFYLDHQLINPKLDPNAQVYYPADLDL